MASNTSSRTLPAILPSQFSNMESQLTSIQNSNEDMKQLMTMVLARQSKIIRLLAKITVNQNRREVLMKKNVPKSFVKLPMIKKILMGELVIPIAINPSDKTSKAFNGKTGLSLFNVKVEKKLVLEVLLDSDNSSHLEAWFLQESVDNGLDGIHRTLQKNFSEIVSQIEDVLSEKSYKELQALSSVEESEQIVQNKNIYPEALKSNRIRLLKANIPKL